MPVFSYVHCCIRHWQGPPTHSSQRQELQAVGSHEKNVPKQWVVWHSGRLHHFTPTSSWEIWQCVFQLLLSKCLQARDQPCAWYPRNWVQHEPQLGSKQGLVDIATSSNSKGLDDSSIGLFRRNNWDGTGWDDCWDGMNLLFCHDCHELSWLSYFMMMRMIEDYAPVENRRKSLKPNSDRGKPQRSSSKLLIPWSYVINELWLYELHAWHSCFVWHLWQSRVIYSSTCSIFAAASTSYSWPRHSCDEPSPTDSSPAGYRCHTQW